MIIGIDPTVDFACKMLLGSPDHPAITLHFLNAVLGGDPRVTDVQILNPIVGKDYDADKLSILDVLATDNQGRMFLELPKYVPPGDNEKGKITDPLEAWAYFFRRAGKSTAEELSNRFADPIFAEAIGVLEMIAKSPEERRYYEARLKMQRDEQARLEAAEAHGRAEGEAHGQAIGRVQLLEQLAGVSESSLEALRQKTMDELAAIESELQRRLRQRS